MGLLAVAGSAWAGAPGAAAFPGQSAPPATTVVTASPPTPAPSTLIDPVLVSPVPGTRDPSTHIRVLLTRLAVFEARDQLAEHRAAAGRGAADEERVQVVLDAAVQEQAHTERALRRARRRLDSSAVFAYMNAPGSDLPSALRGDSTAGGRERQMLSSSMDQHRLQVGAARAAAVLAAARVDAAQQELDRVRRATAERNGRVASSMRALAEARAHLRVAQADERAITPATTWELPIEGTSAFTAGELAEWYRIQGYGSFAAVPMADLARAFVEQGNAEGIRGDMAFAQSIHETGWFSNRDTVAANNYAGIGHCSACAGGVHFASAETGVLAQIQLLKSYAQAYPIYNNPRAAPDLDGPSGCCSTWASLGGVWASDPGYGPRILTYYSQMLEWLVVQRRFGI